MTLSNNGMRRSAVTTAFIFGKRFTRPLMPGVRRLPLAGETSYYPYMKVKEVIKALEEDG